MAGSAVKALKAHARAWTITPKSWADQFREMMETNDRAAAVVGGSILEDNIESLLRNHMRRLPKEADEALFDGTGPLATFSAKVRIAYALNLLTDEQYQTANYVREIRNAFAHARRDMKFEDLEVSAVCALLKCKDEAKILDMDDFKHPRKRYLFTALQLGSEITMEALEREAKGLRA